MFSRDVSKSRTSLRRSPVPRASRLVSRQASSSIPPLTALVAFSEEFLELANGVKQALLHPSDKFSSLRIQGSVSAEILRRKFRDRNAVSREKSSDVPTERRFPYVNWDLQKLNGALDFLARFRNTVVDDLNLRGGQIAVHFRQQRFDIALDNSGVDLGKRPIQSRKRDENSRLLRLIQLGHYNLRQQKMPSGAAPGAFGAHSPSEHRSVGVISRDCRRFEANSIAGRSIAIFSRRPRSRQERTPGPAMGEQKGQANKRVRTILLVLKNSPDRFSTKDRSAGF
jgi:hypothetical protein